MSPSAASSPRTPSPARCARRSISSGAPRAASGLPVCAIGGITLANAPQAIAAGADLVAVVSFLFDSGDILSTTRAFARLFETAHA